MRGEGVVVGISDYGGCGSFYSLRGSNLCGQVVVVARVLLSSRLSLKVDHHASFSLNTIVVRLLFP